MPTFESCMWNAGVLTTTTFSITTSSKFLRLIPQYQATATALPRSACRISVKTVSLVAVQREVPERDIHSSRGRRTGIVGKTAPGPLWMPSLLVPVFTKNPVPQPRPAMLQYPPAGRNRPEISALPSMISVIGLSAVAPAIAAFMRGPSSVAAPPVYLLRPFLRSQSRAQPIFDARM